MLGVIGSEDNTCYVIDERARIAETSDEDPRNEESTNGGESE